MRFSTRFSRREMNSTGGKQFRINKNEGIHSLSPARARASRYRESAYPLSGSLGTFLKCLRCQSSRRKLGGGDARFGDVHSPEKIFANSFRLDFPPSSRIRFVGERVGRLTSPECLFVEQYFRSVSSRPSSPPLHLRREDIYVDVLEYGRSNFAFTRICRPTTSVY